MRGTLEKIYKTMERNSKQMKTLRENKVKTWKENK